MVDCKEERTQEMRARQNMPTTFSVDWKEFHKELEEEFTLIDNKGKAGTDLMTIKQADRPVEAYIADFKIIVS